MCSSAQHDRLIPSAHILPVRWFGDLAETGQTGFRSWTGWAGSLAAGWFRGPRRVPRRVLPALAGGPGRSGAEPRAKESEAAGTAYLAGLAELDWYANGDEYVVINELGVPVHPEWYSDEFTRLLKLAKLRKIRLHDSRHTTLSLMEKAGVPISIVSKWAGHYDSAFTMKTYVHASDDDLKQGTKTLAKIHKIA
jgi:Phage integrase family